MTRRMTTDEFIACAKSVHGERYGYKKSIYIKNNEKLVISCLKHGDFHQSPNSHLTGSGCRECGMVAKVAGRRKSTIQFIKEAKTVHGEKYTYEQSIYQNSVIKICLTCAHHGMFWISPDSLLSGQGCYECSLIARGLKRRKSFEDFLVDARLAHGDKYLYSELLYIDASTKLQLNARNMEYLSRFQKCILAVLDAQIARIQDSIL